MATNQPGVTRKDFLRGVGAAGAGGLVVGGVAGFFGGRGRAGADQADGRRVGAARHPRQRGLPGVIDTPMLRMMDDPVAGAAYLQAGVPQRRLGSADEVAAVIAFLASDDASYLTGAAVPWTAA
jgi:Enoyl-(Acyl carrier protein) reductase